MVLVETSSSETIYNIKRHIYQSLLWIVLWYFTYNLFMSVAIVRVLICLFSLVLIICYTLVYTVIRTDNQDLHIFPESLNFIYDKVHIGVVTLCVGDDNSEEVDITFAGQWLVCHHDSTSGHHTSFQCWSNLE